ncbi:MULTISPECIES: hypothetical protein [Clostridium]|uniref:hypothetical protein n=1 Tax=Clostridium TaxID=1485 RepID=UPI00069FBFED|nr:MULTISPECIES: hypothetical protein [Clostridium]KOF56519.1 hypothetical protein AGR56_07025 [Clostridium sp. DMHC 10]MCD2348845.1 hypothetical protein [Clostridium guangxiense]
MIQWKFLFNENGIKLARKWHQEIPHNLPDKNMKFKVICMLLSGIMFLTVSLISFIMHKYFNWMIFESLIIFSVYAIVETLYYRYLNTFGFASVTIAFIIIYILV